MKKNGPDSKQSWMVVAASCVIKFMTYGPTEVAGMLMVYTMYRFGTTREAASLPYTLVYTLRNGSGPIIAYIGNIIGHRSTILFGCILSSTAIGACFFAESVKAVTILWGIVFGFGFAFEILLLNSITMEHFKNDLSKALGVTNAGAVLGICCFSPYLDFLVNSFGLSGAFLLLAGATLHAIPAALFILLNNPLKRKVFKETGTMSAFKENSKVTENISQQRKKNGSMEFPNCSVSSPDLSPQNVFGTQSPNGEYEQKGCINNIYSGHFETNFNYVGEQVKTTAYKNLGTDAFEINWNKTDQWIDIPLHSKDNEQKYNNQINSTKEKTMSSCTKTVSVKSQLRLVQIDNAPEELQTNMALEKFQTKQTEKLKTNKLMKVLFSHPIFWLILISNGMRYFVLPAFFTLLVDYAIDIGINPEHAKYIVIYATCVEFVGCLVLGWVADLKLLSSNGFAVTMFLSQSLALFLMPWAQNIIFLALVVLVFQWTQTGLSLIYPSVVSDSLEKEIQPSALASMFILAAPLDLAISPLIGFFRDERGSYTGVYLTLSLATFFACLSQMCVLKCVKRKKQSAKT